MKFVTSRLSILSRCCAVMSLAGAMLLPASWAWTHSLPVGMLQLQTIEGITEYRLENGLRVLLAPDEAKPTVTVNMTYLVGARHENYGQTGMAHLLEHMLFRGTPTLRNALAEFSRRGLSANGTTSSDRTNYYASFAADAGQLEWYLRWQADAMVNALIAREDLDAEMTVVRNEMEQGENNPFQALLQQVQAAAYRWHSYGRSVIGARSDVENVDIAQLRAFYQTYYQPDNAVLILSGKFDAAQALAVIHDAFGSIPRPQRTLPREYTVEPVQEGERQVTVRRQGGVPLVGAMFHAPAQGHPDSAALELAVSILGDEPAGPLYKALVESRLAAGSFGYASGQAQPGHVFFGAQLDPGMEPERALQTLQATLDSAVAEGFRQEDLDRVRSRWNTGWTQIVSEPAALASLLSSSVASGDWRLAFLYRDRIAQATLEDVQRVAAAYLVPANRTSGRYLPEDAPRRAPALAPVDLTAMLDGYEGRASEAAVAAFDADPAKIDAATKRESVALDPGALRLALLPKPTRGGQVQAVLRLQFGDAERLKGSGEIPAAVASLLPHGTANMTRQQIEDRFVALQSSASFSGQAGVVVVRLTSQRDQLPQALALVTEILRAPRFLDAELDTYKRMAASSLSSAQTQPGTLASLALARHDNPWPEDDVRYTPTIAQRLARIEALRARDLQAFHGAFYGAGDVLFSAVGDFDADAAVAALRTGLQGWRMSPAYTRISDPYRPVPAARFDLDAPGKANAFYLAQLPMPVQDTDEDYPAMILANYLLGGSATSRLWNRVRVQDGLSYDVGSSLSASAYEPDGALSIHAIHAPKDSAALERAIGEELARVQQDGFTAQEVQEGIQALLNYRKLRRAQDGALASAWIGYLELARTFAWSGELDRRIAALTKDAVDAAMRRMLATGAFSVAVAADEAARKP